ncbi:hypothetical protein Q8A64_15540 [Oxalobacteraceae bacterium R-40]|uniref:Uncharacterized protein n=1 Tax=Keguizhuia sedimenti TaxID=3064264 RepID=A0ABU1BTU8_9BURK|nr:hypothetical protein [Oxalobacteraceae bacterium R-40]
MHIILSTLAALAVLYVLYRVAHSRNAVSTETIGNSHGTLPMRLTGLELAFLSDGKLFYQSATGDLTQLHSPYVQEVIDRVERQRERNAWKQNTGFEIAAYGGRKQFGAGDAQIVATSALFNGPGSILYFLKDQAFGGLFSFNLESRTERRLLHKQSLWLSDLNLNAEKGQILCAANLKNGGANIAVMDSEGNQLRELTGGDTYDSSPAWLPGNNDEILYQSTGIARTPEGHVLAHANATIQLLNLNTQSVAPIMDDPRYDFLQPRVCAQGNLYFIRRPYEPPKYGPNNFIIDTLLFPFRLVRAIFHYLNFFSLVYSRKPLTSASGPALHADLKDIVLKGKRIDAEKALRKGMAVNGVPSLVPASWQLIRRTRQGMESMLATNVVSYDITFDGQIIFSNGRGVFLLAADGKPRLLFKNDVIADVVAYQQAVTQLHPEAQKEVQTV